MKLELIILVVTGFFIANTHSDGKYLEKLKSYKKYYKMALYGFIGLCVYFLFKKNPNQSKNMLMQANDLIRYMPIDKEAMQMLNPIIDFTKKQNPVPVHGTDYYRNTGNGHFMNNYQEQKVMQSGGRNTMLQKKSTKRSVSETKKKWVASNQNWNCGKCGNQLNAWFEVDHKTRLEYGGSNHVNNLIALCRECHGEKTARERL
jgi:5-methylcytosine-specific restriction endonuclease McrA